MLDDFTNEISLLKDWYKKTKEIVIKAESMDSLNKSYIQPLHELRYCLDHFMRALDYGEQTDNKDKIRESINAARSHLQRAYSDSIEWMLVNVTEEYRRILDNYTYEQIQGTFPEYYTKIRPELEALIQKVNNYKITKSVEEAANQAANQFIAEDIAVKLEDYLKTLHLRESSLIDAKKRYKKTSVKDKFIIPILTAAIGAIIATLVTTFILL